MSTDYFILRTHNRHILKCHTTPARHFLKHATLGTALLLSLAACGGGDPDSSPAAGVSSGPAGAEPVTKTAGTDTGIPTAATPEKGPNTSGTQRSAENPDHALQPLITKAIAPGKVSGQSSGRTGERRLPSCEGDARGPTIADDSGGAYRMKVDPSCPTTAISSAGVRGDVVAWALRNINRVPEAWVRIQVRDWDADAQPPAFRNPAVQPEGKVGEWVSREQGPGNQPYRHISHFRTRGNPVEVENMRLPDTVEIRLGQSDVGQLPNDLKNANADATVLTLGLQAEFDFTWPATDTKKAKKVSGTENITTSEHAIIHRDDLFVYNQEDESIRIATWGKVSDNDDDDDDDDDDDHEVVSIGLLRGPQARQFFLCLDSEASARKTLIRHLNCSLWQVPDNWTPGMKLQYQARYVSAVPLARGSRKPNGRAVLWRSGSPEESIRQGLGDQDNHPIPTSPAASGVKAVTERADAARTGDSTQDTYTPAQAEADTAQAGAH